MRTVAVLVALCALSQTAMAQTPDCKAMADANARLACYDKSPPPRAAAARPARQATASKVDAGTDLDSISAEDKLMNARIKNICRGC